MPPVTSPRLQIGFAFVRYAAVGAIGSAAHFAVLIALVQLAAVRPVSASAAGMVAGALVNYHLNRRFTFRSTRRHQEAMWRFFAIAALLLAVNSAAMALLTGPAGLHYLVAQVIATALVLSSGFVGNRLWTFRHEAAADEPRG